MIVDHADRLGRLSTRIFRMRDLARALCHRKFRNDVRLIGGFIPPETVVADVGANHGRVSRELAKLHGGRCRVLAFEPVVYNQLVAAAVLRGYANVTLMRFGLSDIEAETEILMATRRSGAWVHGGASVDRHDADAPAHSQEIFVSNRVKLRALDDVVRELGVERLGFMKLDVEGHEAAVLAGAARTLERDRPSIMMEVRADRREPTAMLGDLGYHFYNLDRRESGHWIRGAAEAIGTLFGNHNDLLCWHPATGAAPPAFVGSFEGTRFG